MKTYKFLSLIILATVLAIFNACTKLDPKPYSGLTTEEFYNNPATIDNAQDLVTTALIGFGNGEQTRVGNSAGGDVLNLFNEQTDNTPYMKESYMHDFRTLRDKPYRQMWNTFYVGISKANLTLLELNSVNSKAANIKKVISDLKVARAFFLYHAMDNFGNIPLDTLFGADPSTVKTNSRLEVFNFIEKELKENVKFLDSRRSPNNRINKYVGYTLMAQLYLNAQVYTGTARWSEASAACDSVLNGPYSLANNYFDNFLPSPSLNENILVSLKDKQFGAGNTFIPENVYPQGGTAIGVLGTPWNSFTAAADRYKIYDEKDKRRRQFLVGLQRVSAKDNERAIDGVPNTGDTIKVSASGKLYPLIYNLDITQWGLNRDPVFLKTKPISVQRMAGARNVKYYPSRNSVIEDASMENDYVVMRLADVILMKAEAELRLGNLAKAATMVNMVRLRAFGDASFNILNPTLKDIHDERSRELMWEGYARRDNIRFEVADPSTPYWSKALFPLKPNADANPISPGRYNNQIYFIPKSVLAFNPNLVQNPGYN